MTKIPTAKEVQAMTAKELVDFYNAFEKPEKTVKRFATRAVGIERVLAALKKAAPPKATSSKVTVASRCRELILAGKDNEEILKIMKFPAEKKHYPGWYRNEMRRKGLI
jgi:hypothetical protein